MDICARYYSPRNRLRTGPLDSDLVVYTAANMLRSEFRVYPPEI
jgi:hypothetical protein